MTYKEKIEKRIKDENKNFILLETEDINSTRAMWWQYTDCKHKRKAKSSRMFGKKHPLCPTCQKEKRIKWNRKTIQEELDNRGSSLKVLKIFKRSDGRRCATLKCTIDGYTRDVLITNFMSENTDCPRCSQTERITPEVIQYRLNRDNRNIMLLTEEYIDRDTPMLWYCHEHEREWVDTYYQVIQREQGCPNCTGQDKYEIEGVIKRVHNKFPHIDLKKETFINSITPSTWHCNKCDHTWNLPATPLLQSVWGCPECARQNAKGSYNIDNAEKYKEEWSRKPIKLYVLECWGNGEHFYKIGLTTKKIPARFAPSAMPYKYSILAVEHTTIYDGVYLEDYLHSFYSTNTYKPQQHFGGWTECFSEIPAFREEIRNYA